MKQRPIRNLNAEARRQLYRGHEKTAVSNIAYQRQLRKEYETLKRLAEEEAKEKQLTAKRREEEQEKTNKEREEAAKEQEILKQQKAKIEEQRSAQEEQKREQSVKPKEKSTKWDLTKLLNEKQTPLWNQRPVTVEGTVDSVVTGTNQVSNLEERPQFYSKKDQLTFFENAAKRQADMLFDPEIEKAKHLKEAALAEYDAYVNRSSLNPLQNIGFGNHFRGTDSAAMNAYYKKVTDADQAIVEIQKQKDRYIEAMKQYTDPNSLFQGQVLRLIKNSDVFLDQMAAYDKAFEDAENAKGTAFYLPKLYNLLFQKTKTRLLGKQLRDLSDYLDTLQVLPRSFVDIPEHLRDIAGKIFTKDGKSLLSDQEFRDAFNASLVVEKSQFDSLSEIAKELAIKPSDIDENFILRKKEEYEMLKDLEASKKTYGANVTISRPGSVGSTNQLEFEAAKKSQAKKSTALNNYDTAIEFLDKALHYKEINDDITNSGNIFYKHFKAYKEFFWDDWKNTFGFDVPNILNATRVGKTADKFENGEPLTNADTALLEALSIENMAHGKWGSFEDDKAYKWGMISAESLKFMSEFIATHGAATALQGTGKVAAKSIMKGAAKLGEEAALNTYIATANKILEHSALNVVAKYGGASAKWLTNAATRLTADATYAAMLTNTLGGPRTVLDALKDVNGNILANSDMFGNIYTTGFEDRAGELEAFTRSEVRNWIENFSEMMGEWGIGKGAYTVGKRIPGVGKMLGKIEKAYTRNLLKDIIADSKYYLQHGIIENNALLARKGLHKYIPAFSSVFNKNVLKAGLFHGFLNEVSEEYYAILLQHAFGVEDDPNKGLWLDVKDQSLDIWGGIATSTGFLGALSMGHAAMSQHKYNNAVQNLIDSFGEENATAIQKLLLFANPMDLMNKYSALMEYYDGHEGRDDIDKFKAGLQNIWNVLTGKGPITLEKKIALADYVNSLVLLRGAVYGQDVIDRAMGILERQLRTAARAAGYTTPSYANLQTMTSVEGMLQTEASALMGDVNDTADKLYERYNGDIILIIRDIQNGTIQSKTTADELINAFVAYHNARDYKEGVDESLSDTARDRVNKRARIPNMLMNKNSGKIQVLYTTDENGKRRQQYLIDGELKTKLGTSEVETEANQYGKESSKILVSDASGRYKYVDRTELKGWKIDPVKYDTKTLRNSIIKEAMEEEWRRRESYLTRFSTYPSTGALSPVNTIHVGDKRVTILDNKGAHGITYAISDENGDNSEIYYADNVNDLNQLIEEILKNNSRNITTLFKKQAADMVKLFIARDKQRHAYKQAKTRNEFFRRKEANIDENDDRSDSDALTPQQWKEQQEREIKENRNEYYQNEKYRYGDYEDSEDIYEDEVEDIIEEEGAALPPIPEGGITVGEDGSLTPVGLATPESVSPLETLEPTVDPKTTETNPIIEIDVPTMGGGTRKEKVLRVDASLLKAGDFIWYSGPDTETPINTATVISVDEDGNTLITDKGVLSNKKAYYKVVQSTPEIVPETPEVPAPPVTTNPQNQQEGYDLLLSDIRRGESQKIAVTGYHYIVNYGGRKRLAKRVHSIQEGSRDNSERWWFKTLLPEIRQRLNNKKAEGAEKIFEEVETILEELKAIDIAPRDKFKDNRGGLTEDVANKLDADRRASLGFRDGKNEYLEYLQEYPEDVDEVIEALSQILAKRDFGLSVVAGNIYDVIAREFLSSDRTTDLAYNDTKLTFFYYGEKKHISDSLDGEHPFVDKQTFKEICKELQQIKVYYENTLGWKLCTKAYTMVGELLVDGKPQLVAGETDCVAIDKNGNRHIVDFKTYNAKNKRYHKKKIISRSGEEIELPHNLYDKDEEGGQIRNVVQEYAEQMSIYKLLQRAAGRFVESAEALFFGIVYKDIYGTRDLQIQKTLVEEKNGATKEYPSYITIDGKTPNRVNLDHQQEEELGRGVNDWLDRVYERVLVLGKSEIEAVKQIIGALKLTGTLWLIDSLSEGLKNNINNFNASVDAALQDENIEDLKSKQKHLEEWRTVWIQLIDEELRKQQEQKKVELRIADEIANRFDVTKKDIPTLLYEYGYEPLLQAWFDLQNESGAVDVSIASEEQLQRLAEAVTNFLLFARYAKFNNIEDNEDVKQGTAIVLFIVKALSDDNRNDIVDNIRNAVNAGTFSYTNAADDIVKPKKSIEITGLEDRAAKAVVQSHDINNPNNKLADVVSNSDFIKHAEFYIQRDESYTGEKVRFEMVIVYNGIEYTPVTINIAHDFNNGTFEFANTDAETLYNNLIEFTNNTSRVKVNNDAIHRTFGRFNDDDNSLKPINIVDLLGKNLSEISYSHSQNDIGLTKVIDSATGPVVVVQVPGALGAKRKTIYQYRKDPEGLPKGGVILMYKPPYEETSAESKDSTNSIPINLESVTFDSDTAAFIAEMLNKARKDPKFLTENYKMDSGAITPLTNRLVIDLFISYGFSGNKAGRTHVNVSIRNGKVVIKGIIQGLNSSDKKRASFIEDEYDFDSVDGDKTKTKFVEFLQQYVRVQIDEDFMKNKLSNIYALKRWFAGHSKVNTIKFGNSPIYISREDAEQNLTGIAWYIRSGMLKTRFNGLHRPLFSLDEKMLLNAESNAGAKEHNGSITEELDPNGHVKFSTVQMQDADGTINEAQARERIREIVGDICTVKFENDVLDILPHGVVVGACYNYMIKLSRMAKAGTEYHEAFHRVLELLVDEKTRERIYKKYRKKFGNDLTDNQIAEFAADEFWWYKENRPLKKFSFNLKELLNIMKQWYRFFTKIGSFELYRLYRAAEKGKFRNNKPTEEALARWKTLANDKGYLPSQYTKNGKTYPHVMNSKQYDAVVETLRYIVMTPSTYGKSGQAFDPTGGTLNALKPTAKMIAESPLMHSILSSVTFSEDAKQRLLEVAGCEIRGNKVVLINNNLDDLLEEILLGLNKFNVHGVTIDAKQVEEKPNVDEYGVPLENSEYDPDKTTDNEEDDVTAPMEGGEYSKKSAEFDPITRATPRVKFFFSRFAEVEPVYVEENGVVKIYSVHKLNAAGLPQLTPYDRAWGMVLNKVYHCKGALEMYDRLRILQSFDERYKPIYNAYKNLLNKAFKKDPKTNSFIDEHGHLVKEINDANAYGLLKEIVTVTCNQKAIPYVAESMESGTDETLQGSLRVFESSMEYQVRDIRASWSAAFSSGLLEFIKRKANGDLELANKKEFAKLIREISQISSVFSSTTYADKIKKVGDLSIELTCRTFDEAGNLKDKSESTTITFSGEKILEKVNANDPIVIEALKEKFVSILNRLGVLVTKEDFDFALEDRSGYLKDSDLVSRANWEVLALITFFDENSGGIGNTINSLNALINASVLGQEVFRNIAQSIWSSSKNILVDTLSTAKYRRRSAEYMLNYLTIGGKKQYAMSEHNAISEMVDELKTDGSKVLDNLLDDPYHNASRALLFVDSAHKDGISLEDMRFVPLPGLKTDAHGSKGVEYLDMSEQEDVVTKYSLLADNLLILETLSDKTTWGTIRMPKAFKAFGIDWVTDKDDYNTEKRLNENERRMAELLANGKLTYTIDKKGQLQFAFDNEVLDQFISYAKSEYVSAKAELARNVKDEEAVDNFDKAVYDGKDGKKIVVRQGARLSTFTGIILDDGTFVSFNNMYKSEAECLADAEKYFFGLVKKNEDPLADEEYVEDIDKQRHLINNVLSNQLRKELQWLQDLGLISFKDGVYTNTGLDKVKLRKVKGFITNYSGLADNDPSIDSKAIVMYVADMVAKAQMSHQEFFRMLGGNMSYYKWKYDKETGYIIDTTQDFFKRMGGLVSTGTHNVIDDFDDELYTCAEIEDEFVEGGLFDGFEEKALRQELKLMVIDLRKAVYTIKVDNKTEQRPITIENLNQQWAKDAIKQISDETSAYDIPRLKSELRELLILAEIDASIKDGIRITDDIRKDIETAVDQNIESIEIRIHKQANALSANKLNVTDGATYISDEFCEKLLKAIGKWDNSIQKAFNVLRGIDKVSDENIRSVAEAYNTVYTTVIGTLKYTAFGFRPHTIATSDGVYTEYTRNDVYYDKTAFFPIFSCMATGHMKAVLSKMKEESVDVLKMKSAIKVGGRGAVECNTSTFKNWDENPDSFKAFKLNTYKQRFYELRKQFNTDPKDKEFMTLGSQYQKVVMLLLHADQIYDADGIEVNARDVRETIMECYNKIAEASLEKHRNKFYKKRGDERELKVDEFVKRLKRLVEDRDASDQLRKYLNVEEYTTEVTDKETGEKVKVKKQRLRLPISAMSSTAWILSIITSIINKDLVDVATPGQAFYQRSAWGTEGTMSEALGNIIGEQDWKYSINHGAPLKAENELHSMDVVLSIDFFNYLFEDHPGLRNQSFTTKKAWLIKNGIISGFIKEEDKGRFKAEELEEIDGKLWHNAQTNIVGYRIPTQAPSSIHAMRCVDVIMAVRDTIIMPKEITGITGSDFDIDKFFLSTLFYTTELLEGSQEEIDKLVKDAGFNSQKELRKAYEKAKSDEDTALAKSLANTLISIDKVRRKSSTVTDIFNAAKNAKEYYSNKLIKQQISLLTTTGNNLAQLHGSIDVDTAPLKEISDKITKKYKVDHLDAFDASSLRLAVKAKMNFAIGKKGIGPYALNNNNHVFTMLYGVKFNDDKGILNDLDLLDLSRGLDKDGHSIPSWISGLINAHVDVAKDPYIRNLGVNEYTYNLVSLLIRTGYGKNTFWFTTQPQMLKLYAAYDIAAGVYHQGEVESKYSRTKNAVDAVLINYIKAVTSISDINTVDQAETAFEKYFAEKYNGIVARNITKALLKSVRGKKVLEWMSTTLDTKLEGKMFDVGASRPIEYKDLLALVLFANDKLLKKAQQLSDLVQYTKIDTKKQGKTVAEQDAYRAKMEQLMDATTTPFEHTSIVNMINNSFIGPKTRMAIEAQKELLSSQLIEATNGFDKLVKDIKAALNSTRTDETFNLAISDAILAKLKSDYFFRGATAYCIQRGINPKKLLLSKTESIHAQLISILNGVLNKNDSRYDSVRDENGKCNNYLLNNLVGHFKNDSSALGYERGAYDFAEDPWKNALFIKNLNVFDDFIKTSDMQNAWEDLLNDTSHPELLRFAEELIVYAFLTSASNGGKYDLFKYVPYSWLTGDCELLRYSGITSFADYIQNLIDKLNDKASNLILSDEEIDELILNFAYSDDLVKIVSKERLNLMPSISTSFGTPVIVAALSNDRAAFLNGEYPGFFKVQQANFMYGQRKFNVYKKVAVGHHTYELGGKVLTVPYPIYALVSPRGGIYKEGQRIYDMGLQSMPNTFHALWQDKMDIGPLVERVSKTVSANSKTMTPEQLFRLIIYIAKHSGEDGYVKVQPVYDEYRKDPEAFKEMVNSILADSKFNVYSYDQWNSVYTNDSESNREAVDYLRQSTILTPGDRYVRMLFKELDELGAFGDNLKEVLDNMKQTTNLHFEYFKKKSEDGTYWNPTITVSFDQKKALGFFEIEAEIDLEHRDKTGEIKYTGDFAVHFKTFSYNSVTADGPRKGQPDIRFANVPLTRLQKIELIQAILTLLPNNATLSTRGTLSKGGVNMISKLDNYINPVTGKIEQVATREVEIKQNDGSKLSVEIPIWKKTTEGKPKETLDKQVPKYTAAKRKEIDNFLTKQIEEKLDKNFFAGSMISPEDVKSAIKEAIDSNLEYREILLNASEDHLGLLTSVNGTNDYSSFVNDVVKQARSEQAAEEVSNSCKFGK